MLMLQKHMRADSVKKQRPSEGAIVIVGMSPDRHAFVVDRWSGDCTIETFARQYLRLARKWNVHKGTFEAGPDLRIDG